MNNIIVQLNNNVNVATILHAHQVSKHQSYELRNFNVYEIFFIVISVNRYVGTTLVPEFASYTRVGF